MTDDILLGLCVMTFYPDTLPVATPACANCAFLQPFGWRFSDADVATRMAQAGWSYWLDGGFLCPACSRERCKWLTGWEE